MQLCLAAPVANGFQPTLTSKNCSTNLRGQHDAASGQFGLPGIVDGDVVGILGLVIGALKERLIFGPGSTTSSSPPGVRMICGALMP